MNGMVKGRAAKRNGPPINETQAKTDKEVCKIPKTLEMLRGELLIEPPSFCFASQRSDRELVIFKWGKET